MTTADVLLAMQFYGSEDIAQARALVARVDAALAVSAGGPDASNAAQLARERAGWVAMAADDTMPKAKRAHAAAMVKRIDGGG